MCVCVCVCVHFFCGHFSRAGEGDEDGEGDEEGFPQRRVFMRWVFRVWLNGVGFPWLPGWLKEVGFPC